MLIQITLVLAIVALIWLGVLTYLFQRMKKNYTVFTQDVHRKTLDEVLRKLVKEVNLSQEDIAKLISRCDTMEKNELLHIQKIGLLRFNPFKDTGGDQSFIMTLMDAQNSGVVITALYSRSGTRWYAKRVVKGKGLEHELSEEEQKAIKEAKAVY